LENSDLPLNIDPDKNQPDVTLTTILWKGTIMALIFTVPSLGVFLGIYYSTGNLILGAVIGFAIHFVTLAFSNRISKFLTNKTS